MEELTDRDSSGQPGLAQLDARVLLYLRKLPPLPSVFPIALKTNMAAFVYFLIGIASIMDHVSHSSGTRTLIT